MGTEHVGPLLYALVCMLRPVSVLEIGAGYTTLFIAKALKDARAEALHDRELLDGDMLSERTGLLATTAATPYNPQLYVVDNLKHRRTTAGRVPQAIEQIGAASLVTFFNRSFVGASEVLPRQLDLVWFDCGAAGRNGIMFMREYWPLIRPDGGILGLHSMHLPLTLKTGQRPTIVVPSSLLNELSRVQAESGSGRRFEILSLVEPHKARQGDISLIRRISPLHAIRNESVDSAMSALGRLLTGA